VGDTNDPEQNFDFIIVLVAIAIEREKKLNKYLKIFSSKTNCIIVIWGTNDTEKNFDFIIFHFSGCLGNRKKIKINKSRVTVK